MPATLGTAGGPLATGDIIRLNMVAFVDSQQGIFGCSYQVESITGPVGVSIGELCVAWSNVMGPRYSLLTAGRVVFIGVKGVFLAPPPAKSSGIANDFIGGQLPNPELPQQASAFIRLESNGNGRRARGRIYVPFPSTAGASTVDGEPTVAYIAQVQVLAQALTTTQSIGVSGVAVNLVPVVSSKTGQFFSSIVRGVAVRKWATQRRRGNFGRLNPSSIG